MSWIDMVRSDLLDFVVLHYELICTIQSYVVLREKQAAGRKTKTRKYR